MPFYYLTANKTRDLCHNSGPLASLRLKYTWGGALISVDLLKITLLAQWACIGLIFGGACIQRDPIYRTTIVILFWWAYMRRVHIWRSLYSELCVILRVSSWYGHILEDLFNPNTHYERTKINKNHFYINNP